jgi:predicted transcriptional regulator
VMNRLLDRGLLERKRRGKAFVYRPRYAESELVARSMRERLAGASADARTPALLSLIEGLEHDELDELAKYANRVRRERRKK